MCCLLLDSDLRIRAASRGVVHCVKEVSESQQVLAEVARDVEEGGYWEPGELLRTFGAVGAVETTRHLERQQALDTENRQLARAIATRDTIGQAKGMLMERFNIDADRAFALLTRLSQETNTRVEQIVRNLVQTDRPPRSGRMWIRGCAGPGPAVTPRPP